MREVLFTGKRVDNGERVFGSYVFEPRRKGAFGQTISELDRERHYIVSKKNYEFWEVIPETVGDYTGLTDKNGKPIFEGDIVKTKYGRLCRVIFFESSAHRCWDLVPIGTTDNLKVKAPTSWDLWYSGNLEVIGNIHDNLELLEVRE